MAVQQLPSILDGFGDSVPFAKEACQRGYKVKGRGPEGFVPGAAHTFMLPARSHLGAPCGGTLPAHPHTSLQDCLLRGAKGLGDEATLPDVQLSGLAPCYLIRSWRTNGTWRRRPPSRSHPWL